jgi:hypothetical protein
VLLLVEPLLNRGPILSKENFYNTTPLAQKLISLKTNCNGTLCINRKEVPKMVRNKKLNKGELIT